MSMKRDYGKTVVTKASDGTATLGGSVSAEMRSKVGDKTADAMENAIRSGRKMNESAMRAVMADSLDKNIANAIIRTASKTAGTKGMRVALDARKPGTEITMRGADGKRGFKGSIEDLRKVAKTTNLVKNSKPGKISIQNPIKAKMSDNTISSSPYSTTELHQLAQQYADNEDGNLHSENTLIEAKVSGNQGWIDRAQKVVDAHLKDGHLTDENRKERDALYQEMKAAPSVKSFREMSSSKTGNYKKAGKPIPEPKEKDSLGKSGSKMAGMKNVGSAAAAEIRKIDKQNRTVDALRKLIEARKAKNPELASQLDEVEKRLIDKTNEKKGDSVAKSGSAMRRTNPKTGVVEFQKGGLMPDGLAKKMPKLYAQDGKGDNARVFAKFFNPVGGYTFYATEYDPETQTMFGLATLSGDPKDPEAELGYVNLKELQSVKLMGGALGIERDINWDDKTTLGDVRGRKKD